MKIMYIILEREKSQFNSTSTINLWGELLLETILVNKKPKKTQPHQNIFSLQDWSYKIVLDIEIHCTEKYIIGQVVKCLTNIRIDSFQWK